MTAMTQQPELVALRAVTTLSAMTTAAALVVPAAAGVAAMTMASRITSALAGRGQHPIDARERHSHVADPSSALPDRMDNAVGMRGGAGTGLTWPSALPFSLALERARALDQSALGML